MKSNKITKVTKKQTRKKVNAHDQKEYIRYMERVYSNFGGINQDGFLLGTIQLISEGKRGLNPIEDLSLAEFRIVRKGLNYLSKKEGLETSHHFKKSLNHKKPGNIEKSEGYVDEHVRIFLKELHKEQKELEQVTS